MIDTSNLKKETRYGVPAADKILFNRHYVLGYSYYFRQAKWALEIVDEKDSKHIERKNHFRPDYRIPEVFRADLNAYRGSGYDRGHLVASSNQIDSEIQNSETFLLSNMAPQHAKFNRVIWRKLESAIRKLNEKKEILETYVITGPLFYFDKEVEMIGQNSNVKVTLPVPHAFFKSVLTENDKGKFDMWSFIIPNEETNKSLEDFQVKTTKIEKISGLLLWKNLVGSKITREKNSVHKIWKY